MKPLLEKRYLKYSIIVPSFNRQDEIRELLESFSRIDFNPARMELIIADDGSQDETEKIVELFRQKFPCPLYFYSQSNQGPGAARNMGMKKAEGDFFIFVDSDCTVPPDWLKHVDQDLHQFQADAFGGRDSFRPDFPVLLKAINYSMTSFLTTGGLRGRRGKKLARFYPRSFNMGLSRERYLQVGGFGTLRHGQDIEYSHRLISSGAKVVYIHDAVVFHKRRTSIKKFFRQVFNWGVARVNLYRIDHRLLEPLHAAPAMVTLLLLLCVLFSLIWDPFWKLSRWGLLTGIVLLIFSGIQAAMKYRSIRLMFVVPVIIPIQIIGYGLGFIFAYTYRVILGKPEFTGFRKKYYQ